MLKFVLFLIIVIIVVYFWYDSECKVEFLNKSQAEQILINDRYFNQFNKNDLIARNCKTINECKYKYKNSILEFNNQEKNAIINYIKKLNNIKALKGQKWRFIKVKSEIENGYPHTHNDCIVISEDFTRQIVSNKGSRTLIHEQIHIMQRKDKLKMQKDLTQNLKFFKVKNIIGIDKYKDRIRANPDEDFKNYWVYKKKILPLCLYNSNPMNIGDANYYGLYIKKNKVVSDLIPLSEIKEYEYNYLGKNNYNGYEVQAEIWENRL
jgi:hypothetical protein